MPLTVAELNTLEAYLAGVMNGPTTARKLWALSPLRQFGAVLRRKDAEPIEVKTYDGQAANISWVQISGHRCALAYNHEEYCIELRDRTLRGDALARFDNDTPATELYGVFERL